MAQQRRSRRVRHKQPADCSPNDFVFSTNTNEIMSDYRAFNTGATKQQLDLVRAGITKKKDECEDEKKLPFGSRYRKISSKQKRILKSIMGISPVMGTRAAFKNKKPSKPMPDRNTPAGAALNAGLREDRRTRKERGRFAVAQIEAANVNTCLLYTSPSPRDRTRSRMPSSA